MNFLNYMLENTINIVRYWTAVKELYDLSDHDLNQLGLTRAEIHTTVYKTMLNK